MDIKIVCIERKGDALYQQSGTMINEKYVITTANILFDLLDQTFHKHYEESQPDGHFYTNLPSTQDNNLQVIWRDPENTTKYIVKNVEILGVFMNNSLKHTCEKALQDWTIDSRDNLNFGSKKLLSYFFVLKIENSGSLIGFKEVLTTLWNEMNNDELYPGDELVIRSVPFGHRPFLESYSKGIVSNVLGKNSCLVVSDCPTTPGSEGSAVFRNERLVGLVLCSTCWWRGDWTNLTLIVNLRPLVIELLRFQNNTKQFRKIEHEKMSDTIEGSLIQVYSGSTWGTAILIDKTRGLLITNAHVLDSNDKVKLYWKNQLFKADVLYKARTDAKFDLAILKISDRQFFNNKQLKSIRISPTVPSLGKEVYICGYALFPKEIQTSPMLTKGFIAQLDETAMKTTCCVNPGMSGGAILNSKGELLGIVVSNIKLQESGSVFPRYNNGIPYKIVKNIMDDYSKSNQAIPFRQINMDYKL